MKEWRIRFRSGLSRAGEMEGWNRWYQEGREISLTLTFEVDVVRASISWPVV